MVDSNYNPVIAYMLLDSNRHLIGPDGTDIDPAFHTKKRALKSAEEYGREAEAHEVGEIYYTRIGDS